VGVGQLDDLVARGVRLPRRVEFRLECRPPVREGAEQFRVSGVAPRSLGERRRSETDDHVTVAGAVVTGRLKGLVEEGAMTVVNRRERPADYRRSGVAAHTVTSDATPVNVQDRRPGVPTRRDSLRGNTRLLNLHDVVGDTDASVSGTRTAPPAFDDDHPDHEPGRDSRLGR